MPPKKKTAAAAKQKSTRTTGRAVPDTVTNNRGKEIETTAAARRATRGVAAPEYNPKAVYAAPAAPAAANTSRKRGRPATVQQDAPKKRGPGRSAQSATTTKKTAAKTSTAAKTAAVSEPAKRGRGRPPKSPRKGTAKKALKTTAKAPAPKPKAPAKSVAATATGKKRGRPSMGDIAAEAEEPAKKRGRPSNSSRAAAVPDDETAPPKKRGRPSNASRAAAVQDDETVLPKKRGRPSNASRAAAVQDDETALPKKRGRPSNASRAAAVQDDETAPPRKRGRPPKGGETTKIDTDDPAAAEQLEDELEDTAAVVKDGPSGRRKGLAAPKGKSAKAKKSANENDESEEQDREPTASGINYWLMKAEQDGHDVELNDGSIVNTTFTIDDLRSKADPEPWDGVRNLSAAANLRNMRASDMAFFYASGGKQGRKPGITGIMEIVSNAEPDTTAFDENSAGYEPKEANRQRWVQVRVEFRKKLTKPVYLAELQQFKNGELRDLQEFNAARLSVSKVSEKEWHFINGLIEGFDDDENTGGDLDEELERQVAGPSGTAIIEEDITTIVTERPNGDVVVEEQTDIVEEELDLLNGYAPQAVMQTTEPDLPTTDTIFPDATSATARPASRAGSRRSSRAPSATGSKLGVANSSHPTSRAGSLAPPTGRGRSRTPGGRGGSVGPLPGANLIEDPTGLLESVLETADEF